MYIAVHSASEAVTRTLERIIQDAGHRLAQSDGGADLILIDQSHPSSMPLPAGPTLTLGGAASDEASIACPMRPARLLQRLTMQSATHTVGLANGWSLDMLARMLQHRQGESTNLTEKECSLLNHLVLAQPHSISRDDLLEQVWGMSANVDTHTLETHIYRLRAKLSALSPIPCDILTAEGAYRLVFTGENS